jgi:RTX calcium-binding nonapeptide repeat (4 copies)
MSPQSTMTPAIITAMPPDLLHGNRGNDALNGGSGTDTCYQGSGSGPRSSCELP